MLDNLGFAGRRDVFVHLRRRPLSLKHHVLRRRMQVAMPTIEHPDERVVEVVHQMPAVCYLPTGDEVLNVMVTSSRRTWI